MINVAQLLGLIALGVFLYFVYIFKKFVDLYEHQAYTNYKEYKANVQQSKKIWKPERDASDVSIHTIKGDRQKITTKQSNGLSKTDDTLIDLSDADPGVVMGSIDEFGNIKG